MLKSVSLHVMMLLKCCPTVCRVAEQQIFFWNLDFPTKPHKTLSTRVECSRCCYNHYVRRFSPPVLQINLKPSRDRLSLKAASTPAFCQSPTVTHQIFCRWFFWARTRYTNGSLLISFTTHFVSSLLIYLWYAFISCIYLTLHGWINV